MRAAGEPYLHDVIFADLAEPGGKLDIHDRVHARPRWGVVEPDGFEPTTSCLQSRRSTN